MKAVVIASLILATILAGCLTSSQTKSVRDVTRGETLVLRKLPGQGHVHSLWIAGSGSVSGTAEVRLIENGTAVKTASVTGPVRFEWTGDWYVDSAEVRYEPLTASAGSLQLEFRFQD